MSLNFSPSNIATTKTLWVAHLLNQQSSSNIISIYTLGCINNWHTVEITVCCFWNFDMLRRCDKYMYWYTYDIKWYDICYTGCSPWKTALNGKNTWIDSRQKLCCIQKFLKFECNLIRILFNHRFNGQYFLFDFGQKHCLSQKYLDWP